MNTDWGNTIRNYGIVTALLCLEHFEIQENYEVCAEIIKAIDAKNDKIEGLNLPTRLDAEAIKEVRKTLCESFDLDADNMMERYKYYAKKIIRSHP